jgi:hypothetical protein
MSPLPSVSEAYMLEPIWHRRLRVLIGYVALLSLVSCILACGLWIRSYWRYDRIGSSELRAADVSRHDRSVGSSRGRLLLAHGTQWRNGPEAFKVSWSGTPPMAAATAGSVGGAPRRPWTCPSSTSGRPSRCLSDLCGTAAFRLTAKVVRGPASREAGTVRRLWLRPPRHPRPLPRMRHAGLSAPGVSSANNLIGETPDRCGYAAGLLQPRPGLTMPFAG